MGRVTARERDEILALFERKNGLTELAHALAAADDEVLKNSYFYDKLVMDMGNTTTKYQQWWGAQAKLHQWDKADGEVWEIDFDTCQVFLRKPWKGLFGMDTDKMDRRDFFQSRESGNSDPGNSGPEPD